MIKIMPKLTGSDIVNKEVLRILANVEGLTANEICDTFYIPYDSYYYYRDLTPLIKVDMDLQRKNYLRNKAYKIADDAMNMYSVLMQMSKIKNKLNNELNKESANEKILDKLNNELLKLNGYKWYLNFLVHYGYIEGYLNYEVAI